MGGLFLRVAEVIQAERAGNEARGIFDALQSHERNEVLAAIFAPVNLQVAKAVLA